jgi:hypothetical protein
MDNDTGNNGDGRCHVSTPGVLNTPSSTATETTVLSPTAKQTYFKEHRVQIPETEKVCTVKHICFRCDSDYEHNEFIWSEFHLYMLK